MGVFRQSVGKVLGQIVGIVLIASFATGVAKVPVYADDNCEDGVKTSILGNEDDGKCYRDKDGKGDGIFEILSLVIDVMTFGIVIAATVGLVIAGIQYATGGDNPAQLKAAKTRIFQIVLGLAIYAVFWGVLKFLLPGGLFGDGS